MNLINLYRSHGNCSKKGDNWQVGARTAQIWAVMKKKDESWPIKTGFKDIPRTYQSGELAFDAVSLSTFTLFPDLTSGYPFKEKIVEEKIFKS